jgi:uncharacterized NAD-dependent epimerase/dehydratase family protein
VRRELQLFLLAALLMLAATGTSWSADQRQPLLAGGLEIFYGVIPAEIILGHPADHDERKMHGGVPGGRGQHHLVLSLFDAKTRQRITDAAVTAKVSEPGLGAQRRKLEVMRMGEGTTYGNYFRMPAAGPYRIEVEILRPGSSVPVTTSFAYSHPRR